MKLNTFSVHAALAVGIVNAALLLQLLSKDPTSSIAAYPASNQIPVSNGSLQAKRHSQGGLPTPTIDEHALRDLIRTELENFRPYLEAEKHSNTQTKEATMAWANGQGFNEIQQQVDFEIDAAIGLGQVNNDDFNRIFSAAEKLPPKEKMQALKKLAQAINQKLVQFN